MQAIRTSPDGRVTKMDITNPKQQRYLEELKQHGYKVFFIHKVDNECSACEA